MNGWSRSPTTASTGQPISCSRSTAGGSSSTSNSCESSSARAKMAAFHSRTWAYTAGSGHPHRRVEIDRALDVAGLVGLVRRRPSRPGAGRRACGRAVRCRPRPGPRRGRGGRWRGRSRSPRPSTTRRWRPWRRRPHRGWPRHRRDRCTGPWRRPDCAEAARVEPDHAVGLGQRRHLRIPHPPVGDAGVEQEDRRGPAPASSHSRSAVRGISVAAGASWRSPRRRSARCAGWCRGRRAYRLARARARGRGAAPRAAGARPAGPRAACR